jgi:RND family efflux transporter MFP subunit
MKYAEENSNAKSGRLTKNLGRIGLLVVLIIAGVALFQYRTSLASRIAKVFPSTEDETIPLTKLTKQPFALTVMATGEVVGLETTPVPTPSTNSGSLTISWLIPEGSFVREGDPVVRFDSTDAKLAYEKQQNTLESNQERTKITTLQQSTDEKVLSIDQNSAEQEYQYAKTVMPQDETIFSKWDIITAKSDIRYNKENVDFLKSKGKTQKRIARSDQQILSIDRNKAQAAMNVAKKTLDSLELKAPTSGLVLYRRDHREDPKIGDNSQPGQVVVEVINLDALQAQIYVLERDGGSLEKGQPVIIKLDAIPEKQYHGVIRTVSSVAAALERNSPLKYFTCDVSISDAGRDLKQIRPGMNLRGDVVLQKYESCFVVPSGAVTVRDNMKDSVVFVKKNSGFETRVVKTGLSSHGEAIILEGVQEGEMIALADPNGTRKLYLPDFNKGTQQGPGGFPGGMMPPRGGGMMMGGPPR